MRKKDMEYKKFIENQFESIKFRVKNLEEDFLKYKNIAKFCAKYPTLVNVEVEPSFCWGLITNKTVRAHIFNFHTGELIYKDIFIFDSNYENVEIKSPMLTIDNGSPKSYSFSICFNKINGPRSLIEIKIDLSTPDLNCSISNYINLPSGFIISNDKLPIKL